MMKKMMFLAALLMSFAATAPLFADNNEKELKEPFAVYKFPAKDIKKVTVSTAGGSIRVNGDATGEAVVEVWVRPSSGRKKLSKKEIKKLLDEYYTLSVKSVAGELHAEAGHASGTKGTLSNGLSISFHLSVPQKVASKLSTSGGSIHIRNLTGKEELNTSGGSLHIEDVNGTVTGRTSGGSIHLSGSQGIIDLATSGGSIHAENSQGQLNLKTAGGSLRLSGLRGNIDAATSGGSIHLSGLTGTVKANTSGGSVHADHVDGALITGTSGGSMKLTGISGNLEARTTGGSMNVQMTLVSEYVRLSNSGNISLSLPGDTGYTLKIQGDRIETEAIKNFQGTFESKYIDGTLNGGGAEISVKSSQRVKLTFE
ncbi:MAG: DUF4097 domain-containing protein [Prevotellaceae bacterium]|jgi:hypothetical protein|nr:DUF4097 domain-containing protein [Prevotellaceae bacterium]